VRRIIYAVCYSWSNRVSTEVAGRQDSLAITAKALRNKKESAKHDLISL
jgi:hypothetical protein